MKILWQSLTLLTETLSQQIIFFFFKGKWFTLHIDVKEIK